MTPIHTLPPDIQSLVYCQFACILGLLFFIGLWRQRWMEEVQANKELRKLLEDTRQHYELKEEWRRFL